MTLTRRKDPVTYIPLPDAITAHGLDAEQVRQAAESGEIETARLPDNTVLLLDESLREWLAVRQVSRAHFTHLEGQPISIYEASKRYGFSQHSIRNWIESGSVKEIGTVNTGRRQRLVNEADVAYARALADLKKPIAGQGVFG